MAEPEAVDPTSLALEPIVAEAAAKAGRSRFDDESFREPLARLLDSLDREAGLSPVGRATQHARLVESLVMRHVLEQHESRHPEIRAEEIAAPLVIVGLARTGTTMLHRLLSADPGLYSARWWEVRFPAPFPGWDWRGADPRLAEAHAQVQCDPGEPARARRDPSLGCRRPRRRDHADRAQLPVARAGVEREPAELSHVARLARSCGRATPSCVACSSSSSGRSGGAAKPPSAGC